MKAGIDTELVIGRLRSAPKYRTIHPDTIADVVRTESTKAVDNADLENRARLKLHKVAAIYLLTTRTNHLLRGLPAADGSPAALRAFCRGVLGSHFSSAERLPDLDRIYPTIFGAVPPIRTVADVACALNPFSLPWLREVTDADYIGYDLNEAYVALSREFLTGRFTNWAIEYCDVIVTPAVVTADVALLLKTYHTIEDRAVGAGPRLVAELGSPIVVVSFPLRTMSGRNAPFTPRMVADLEAFGAARGWRIEQIALPTELLVFVHKDDPDARPG